MKEKNGKWKERCKEEIGESLYRLAYMIFEMEKEGSMYK